MDHENGSTSCLKCGFPQEAGHSPDCGVEDIDIDTSLPVRELLMKYVGSHVQVADALISAGRGGDVARYQRRFKGVDSKELATKLLDRADEDIVAEHLDFFEKLTNSHALRLIQAGHVNKVLEFRQCFENLSDGKLSLYIDGYESDSMEQLVKLLDEGQAADYVDRVIKKDRGDLIAKNVGLFEGAQHNEIAQKLINAGSDSEREMAMNIRGFSGLVKEIAFRLIEDGYVEQVAWHINCFRENDRKDIIDKIASS